MIPILRVCLLATLLVGCNSTSSPRDLRVTAAVSPSTIRDGDSATVIVSATNLGDGQREINANACPAPYVVLAPDGTEVGPMWELCTLNLVTKVLAPGESFDFVLPWPRLTQHGEPLSPGTYTVRGKVIAAGIGLVESEPAEIRIVQ